VGKPKKEKKEKICPECGSVNIAWHGLKNESYFECSDCAHEFGRESWGKKRGKEWYAD
jgi:predicted RNA-binding Zn-ribbon protein involved in translation (DUF1610 family)